MDKINYIIVAVLIYIIVCKLYEIFYYTENESIEKYTEKEQENQEKENQEQENIETFNSATSFFNIPTGIPGLKLWLDGADPNNTGIAVDDGSALTTWVDKSGSKNNGSAVSGQPTITKGIVTTSVPYRTSYVFDGEQTFFIVVKATKYDVPNTLYKTEASPGQDSNGGPTFYLNTNIPCLDKMNTNSAHRGKTYLNLTTPYIFTITISNSKQKTAVYVNGALDIPASSTASYPFATNGSNTIITGSANITISEVIAYNNVLSTNDRETVEGYLRLKWNIPTPTAFTVCTGYSNSTGQGNGYTSDGINWSKLVIPDTWAANGVGYDGSRWLLHSQQKGGNYQEGLIYTSIDGINWTRSETATKFFLNYRVTSFVWNGTIWVAGCIGVNGNPPLAYSYDGDNWTWVTSPPIGWTQMVAWSGSMWVACGNNIGRADKYSIAYSPDGINWKPFKMSTHPYYYPYPSMCNAVATNGSMWVAVGINGSNSVMCNSTDGIDWLKNIAGSKLATGLTGVATNGSMWVAVGYTSVGIALYSSDGITWIVSESSKSVFTGGMQGVTWNGKLWVAGAYGGNAITGYSSDGITWTKADSGNTTFDYTRCSILATTISQPIKKVTPYTLLPSLNNFMIATSGGDQQTGAKLMLHSYDGINWTHNISGSLAISNMNWGWGTAVAYNGSMWVTMGLDGDANPTYGRLAYSYDGINWTLSPNSGGPPGYVSIGYLFSAYSGNALATNGSTWVAGLYNDGRSQKTVIYSTDGINWKDAPSYFAFNPQYCHSLCWTGKNFVGVGQFNYGTGGVIGYSPDGINWTKSQSGCNMFTGVPAYYATVYCVKSNGSITIAVGTTTGSGSQCTMAYSYDDITWFKSTSGNSVFSYWCRCLEWNGSMWVACGVINGAWGMGYSSDGINWKASPS